MNLQGLSSFLECLFSGFDGLRFNSSLNTGGINVVLFNPDVCKAISSDLVEIKGIHIEKDEAQIYKIGIENPR